MNHESASVPDRLRKAHGLRPGAASEVSKETGVPEATVYGVGSFFHLLSESDVRMRVCTGLSCRLRGADALLEKLQAAGIPSAGCSCLAACDRAPAAMDERCVVPEATAEEMLAENPDHDPSWRGVVGPQGADEDQLAMDLLGTPDYGGAAFARAQAMGVEALLEELEASGLQGRGGAGFPAHIKWRAVRSQKETTRYVVLNADEGEPGTFKDRELMLRRPDKVLEGLAIAAWALEATEIYLYLRGEFQGPWKALEEAIARFEKNDALPGIRFHLHEGHGAYICGEETALLEALEGKRGMPRLKPPFPVEVGLWGKPTLIQNVETIACVPAIVTRGGAWFRALGREEAGSKLYCISGHVQNPGVYELPLGVSFDELMEAAGGWVGTPKAFSPGGASSGFLPASLGDLALDYGTLGKAGSMLGSAGVVALNDSVAMPWAVASQLAFFEAESCGQCAPCRIGTRYLRVALERSQTERGQASEPGLDHVAEAAWQMNEGSICGLGQAAPLPLTTALKHFPEEFAR